MKETKRDGKGAGRLSTIIVPKRAANPTRGEPKEERVVPGDGTVVGKHEGCDGIRKRVHETAADSRTGIANPSPEEPYALIALVRVCGGLGGKPPILPGRPARDPAMREGSRT